MTTSLRTASLVALVVLAAASAGCSLRQGGEGRAAGAAAETAGASVDPSVGFLSNRVRQTPPPESHCTPAPALMDSALCVCKGLGLAGELTTRSTRGLAADVGIEGDLDLASGSSIGGKLRVTGGISFAGDLAVSGDAWAHRGVSLAGTFAVGGDLASGAAVEGAGDVHVNGKLLCDATESVTGTFHVAGRAPYARQAASPCGCDERSFYDVAGAVATARTTNDNAAIGLAEGGEPKAGEGVLTLPAGRYYVKSLEAVGRRELRAEGNVQLYVDGDVTLVGEHALTLATGATLDLFVAGAFSATGEIALGAADRPEAFRLYIGGGSVDLTGSQAVRGLVYAPRAEVGIAGTTSVHGALFAGSLSQAGTLDIDFAAVTAQNKTCEVPSAAVTPPAPAPEPVTLR